jgi:phage terminase large subunit
MQLLQDLISLYGLSDFAVTKNSIVNRKNGSDFLFNGLRNNVQSVKSIEGIDIAWVEEAQTISEDSLEVLTPTVRKPGSQLIYTYNRLRDKDPVHQRLVIDGRPNTLILNVNYDVALKYGWMSEPLRLEMEDDKAKRPEVYKHKWLGEPSNHKGQIYPDWKKIDAVPEEAKYLGPGLDFGYTNDPTAIIDVYKWNNAYILDEVMYERGQSNLKIANRIRENEGLDPVQRDGSYEGSTTHLTIGDSSEPKSIDEIDGYGVTIMGAVKGKDSVNNGIQKMQELEIYYTASSHNIEEEQLNYVWKVNKEDKSLNVPIDAYNHAMDAARYKIMEAEGPQVEYGGVIFG